MPRTPSGDEVHCFESCHNLCQHVVQRLFSAGQTASCSRVSVSVSKCPRAALMCLDPVGPTGLRTAATTGKASHPPTASQAHVLLGHAQCYHNLSTLLNDCDGAAGTGRRRFARRCVRLRRATCGGRSSGSSCRACRPPSRGRTSRTTAARCPPPPPPPPPSSSSPTHPLFPPERP